MKIIFKQDEQYRTLAVAEFIGSRAFDLVFTCVDAQERAKVYPPTWLATGSFSADVYRIRDAEAACPDDDWS